MPKLPIERAKAVAAAFDWTAYASPVTARADLAQMIDEAIWDAIISDRVDRNAPHDKASVVDATAEI